jgi:hypothetical protein
LIRSRIVIFLIALSVPCFYLRAEEAGCKLPDKAEKKISSKYLGYEIIRLESLTRDYQEAFKKDHGAACPGVVNLDFFGDKRQTYAILLKKDAGKNHLKKMELIIVSKPENKNDWVILSVDHFEDVTIPVIWEESPGKYDDVEKDISIRAKNPVIFLVGYESWGIVYAWINRKVEKVWIKD